MNENNPKEKKYGNPAIDSPNEFMTEEEFLNKKVGGKNVAEIEELFPGFKKKYADALSKNTLTTEVAQMIADANVLTKEQIAMLNTKKEWQDKIAKGTLTEKDINDLVSTMLGEKKDFSSPFQEKGNLSNEETKTILAEKIIKVLEIEKNQPETIEHKEFREELQSQNYTPEQAVKNTAIREQREIQKEINTPKKSTPQEPQTPSYEPPTI